MAYIGQEPLVEFSSVPTKDSFTGDGSTVAFDMATAVVSAADNALEVFIDNVRQEPGSGKAYTVGLDGSNENKRITFSAAPANGAAIYVINDKSNTTTLVTPTNLGGVELILDADNDTSITADTDDQIDFKIGSADHLKILSSSGDTVFKPMVDAKDIIFQQFDGNKIFCIDDGNFVSVGGNSAAPGEIRIYEDTDLGANYTGFKAGNLTASVAYQLPLADGSSGQALATDGSGVLSWATVSANVPTSADGQALGSASLEWSDLFLADGGTIQFGNDQDINLTHVHNAGLTTNADFTVGDDLFVSGGLIDLKNTGTVSTIKFYCESSNAHAQSLVAAPHAQGATNTLTLPDGNDGVLLSTVSTATVTNKTLTSPVINTGTFGTSILPVSADGTTLGSASKEFSDLFLADSSTIQFGNDQDTTLTHTDGAGLTLNSTNKLMFNDASQFIQGASATVLDIAATDEIELTATLIDVVGNLTVSGTINANTIDAGNSNIITGGDIKIDVDADADDLTGDSATGRLAIGAGEDLNLYHGGTNSYIVNDTGNLVINTGTSDADILFSGNDGGSAITALTLDMSEGGSATFNKDVLLSDNSALRLGTSQDLALFHDGSNSFIRDSGTGDLKIISDGNAISLQKGTSETMAFFDTDAGVFLYHDNAERFGTSATETVFNDVSNDVDFRIESNDGTHTFFVNGGNNSVQIGRADSDGVANVKLQVEAVDSSSGVSIHRGSADTGGPALYLSSSRGASLGDDTIVQSGDDLGSIAWFGADGTDRNSAAASISAQVDGTPGSNDMPGRILFKTTLDGGVTQHERMRITNAGNVGIGETTPLGKLHIKTADSGQSSANANRDELVIEGSGNSGMTILSGTSSVGGIAFGDSGGNLQGLIQYSHANEQFEFNTNSSSNPLNVNSNGITVGDDISISGSTPTITLTDTDDNSDCMIYQGAGNLYLEADKNSEASSSYIRFAVDDLDMAHIYNGETVFNESSRDQNFRIESDGNANMFKLDAGNNAIGIGSDPIAASMLHIKQASSSQSSVSANAEEFIIEDDDNCGMTILSGTGNTGTICFGDSGDDNIGQIQYHHSEDSFKVVVNTAERFRITDGGKVGIFEASPDCSDGGLTISQSTGDSKILTFKSSDVGHSMTTRAEADTYGFIQKAGANDGGLQIQGLNDAGNVALQLRGLSNGGEDTGKGTGDHGCVRIDATSRSGTTTGTQGSNVNMVTICNNNTVRFIFDAEGDLHADGSLNAGAFDTYEDAQLVRAYDLSHGKGVIASKFDDFVKYNVNDLTDAGLVGKVNHEYNEDGTKATPLINMTGFMRLHNGAIWQQYEKTQRLTQAMYKLATKTLGKEEADKLLDEEEIKLLN